MRKALLFVLVFALCLALVGCASGKKLTLDNYKQYLDLSNEVDYIDLTPVIKFKCTPYTTNYDFNDVVITVGISGTLKESGESFNITEDLELTIGGTLQKGEEIVHISTPNATGDRVDSYNFLIISVRGTVSK